MAMKNRTSERADTYTIENPNYGEFNGFRIGFEGFDRIPSLFFYRGLPRGFRTGKYLLEALKREFPEFKLTIVKDGQSGISRKDGLVHVRMRMADIRKVIDSFRTNYRNEGTKTVDKYLGSLFPKIFGDSSQTYRPDSLSSIISKETKCLELSELDRRRLMDLIPTLRDCDVKSQHALRQLLEAKMVLHYLRLEELLNEFENKLGKPEKESLWQRFFKKNLLILNPTYIKLIEKPNISLRIQLPDFILLTVDNYVDVYEIKLPETTLLSFDRAHNNYWSTEMTKAISQVENYIDSIAKSANDLAVDIRKRYKLELSVVRPRGYVIAGHTNELKGSEKKRDDFRLLNESLRNTNIIPYDDWLARFRNLSRTLKEAET